MTDERPTLSDPELVLRLHRGDEAALGAIYDRHGGLLYGSVLRFVGDRQMAEEVVQDTFVTLWRDADRFDPSVGGLPGWLLRIARNRAIDRLRAAARRPSLVELSAIPGVSPGTADDGVPRLHEQDATADPAERAERAWTRSLVRTALSTMPEPERLALELAYVQDLTQAEIAERLGWPLGTVKSRTRRGLASLRLVLEGVPDLADTAAPSGRKAALGASGPAGRTMDPEVQP
jgi:RNA polymerase sigma-70 factor (ECF subfamily)